MADPYRDPKRPFVYKDKKTGKLNEYSIDPPGLGGSIVERARVGSYDHPELVKERNRIRKERGLPTDDE